MIVLRRHILLKQLFQFDSDLERMQQERGEVNNGQMMGGGRGPPQMDRGMMGLR